ncbi:hypothetical protein BOTBODRAFT_245766 [Botryobasidium botryosum FD-172 SS1]|uniref:Uncharacterized protein n=1 Tax=Botryobasidium botryosum (strain FD-172 SS1) TaxID=930990 RepID=A0A067LTY5_BOTB1|nr:hypothetical protein BOTBODRAFT_245766 [Botryobasidium botryosum FD-172 SS1]
MRSSLHISSTLLFSATIFHFGRRMHILRLRFTHTYRFTTHTEHFSKVISVCSLHITTCLSIITLHAPPPRGFLYMYSFPFSKLMTSQIMKITYLFGHLSIYTRLRRILWDKIHRGVPKRLHLDPERAIMT